MSMCCRNDLEWTSCEYLEINEIINLISIYSSALLKVYIIRFAYKLPIVILHDIYIVMQLQVFAIVIHRCFGIVLCQLLVHANINEQSINIVLHMIIIGVMIQVRLDKIWFALSILILMEVNMVNEIRKKI